MELTWATASDFEWEGHKFLKYVTHHGWATRKIFDSRSS